jgi:transcriptional regulator with XRE-family HTH domain
MLQQIPHQGAVPASPVTPEPESPEPLRKYRAVCFFREFEAPIPEEIAARIREGVYFLRAWREYRELTRRDVAELMGKTHDNVSRHENAYCIPGEKTLRAFADIFDCSLAQLTPKEGSSTAPWLEVVDDRGERGERGNPAFPPASPQPSTEELGPGSSEYPKAVVAHIIGGKSPITAWRVYRDLSIADLANAYGCTPDNIKQLEAREGGLRRGTREKLAAVFHCPADQLQRPDDIQVAETPLRVSKRTAQPEEVLRRARRAEARSA